MNHEQSYQRSHPGEDIQIDYDRVVRQLLVVVERTKRAGRDRLHDEGTADRGMIPTIVFGLRRQAREAAGDI